MSKLSFLKDEFPRITERIELGDYDEQFRGDFIEVWLNWSKDFQRKLDDHNQRLFAMQKEKDTDKRAALFETWLDDRCEMYAEFWGCETADVLAIAERDPTLWNWIDAEATHLRTEFRTRRKNSASDTGDT